MINKRLDKIEEYLKEIKDLANTDYFKQVEKDIELFCKENNELKDRIDKAVHDLRLLREKYFRECVAGSSEDLSEIIHILEGEDNDI